MADGSLPPAPTLTKWDRRYLGLAAHIRGWSKDPRGRVGAVLVAPDLNRIVATGFNGFPQRIEDDVDRLSDKPTKLDMMLHAEQSALLHAGRDARGATLYVVGKPVCNHCAVLAIQSGIRRVVAAAPRHGTKSEWDRRGFISARLFAEAGLTFDAVQEDVLREVMPGEVPSHEPTPAPSAPDPSSPAPANPDLVNPDLANPDLANPDLANPDRTDPDRTHPNRAGPDRTRPIRSDANPSDGA